MQNYRQVDEALNLFAPGDWIVGDSEPAEFTPPTDLFPVFKKALTYYQDRMPGHAVQIDTPGSYKSMVDSGRFKPVAGVVPEGVECMKCYHDGQCVFVSILFEIPDGETRVATSAATPMSEEAFQGWSEILGSDPVAFLALLPEASRSATGKRLLVSTANAIDSCRMRDDVIGMEAPIMVSPLSSDTAPLAALMYLEQLAQKGNRQAINELAIMHGAAETAQGQRIAAPLLKEASARLAAAQKAKGK